MVADYKEKQAIITLKLDYIQRRLSKWYYLQEQITPYEDLYLLMDQKRKIIKKFNNKYKKINNAWSKAELLNNSKYKRKQRVQKKVSPIIQSHSGLFLTLTFTDEVLSSTQEHIRRKYVQRWCKANSSIYAANIDYGDKKAREHYHAVLQGDHVGKWPYGFMKVQRIKVNGTSEEKLSKYITKLTNHAIKKTAQLKRLIYSRNK